MPSKYTVTVTVVDNFPGRSSIHYGVGEELRLSVREEPAAVPPTGMAWVVKSGYASVGNVGSKGAATVKFGNVGGTVVLELRKTSDNQTLATKRYEVVAPKEVKFSQVGSIWHVQGFASAGFKAAIYLLPKDVSFKWVEVREGEAPYLGSGCLTMPKGAAIVGNGKFTETVVHPVMGTWVHAKAGGSSSNGTEMLGNDTVRTGTPKPGKGELTWRIPWYYRVKNTSVEYRFCEGLHHAVIDDAGTTTMSKFNISVSKAKNDISSG